MITGAQIREARDLLGWPAYRLAQRVKLTTEAIRRAESVDGDPPLTIANVTAIQKVLEAAGVVFTDGEKPDLKPNPRKLSRLAQLGPADGDHPATLGRAGTAKR